MLNLLQVPPSNATTTLSTQSGILNPGNQAIASTIATIDATTVPQEVMSFDNAPETSQVPVGMGFRAGNQQLDALGRPVVQLSIPQTTFLPPLSGRGPAPQPPPRRTSMQDAAHDFVKPLVWDSVVDIPQVQGTQVYEQVAPLGVALRPLQNQDRQDIYVRWQG